MEITKRLEEKRKHTRVGKGLPKGPLIKFRNRVQTRNSLIKVSEFRTSMLCFACGNYSFFFFTHQQINEWMNDLR